MARLRFSGIMAVLLLLAGCAVPVGYPGYYGGYGGYEAYSGTYASPYSSVPVVPYGYSGITPYYGYGYESSSPVIVNNPIPVPVSPDQGTVSDPCAPSGSRYSSHYRHRRHYYGSQDNYGNNPIPPGGLTPGSEASANPGTDPSGTTTASQRGRFNRWTGPSGHLGTDPNATPGTDSVTGTPGYRQNRGSQTYSPGTNPVPGGQNASGPSQTMSGNQPVSPFGSQRRYPSGPGQANLSSQPRPGVPQYSRPAMTGPAIAGSMGRASSPPVLTSPRVTGSTAMRAPQRPAQGQTSGNAQKRAIPGVQ